MNLQLLCLGTLGSDCRDTYEVEQGDTCQSVADNYSIDPELIVHNNGEVCDNLIPGEVTKAKFYTKNDTCYLTTLCAGVMHFCGLLSISSYSDDVRESSSCYS